MKQGKVFISSILDPKREDLLAERDMVREVIESYSFLKAWAFEREPASSNPLDESYLRNVDDCDLLILIVGNESSEAVARECLRAIEKRKPILSFAKNVSNRTAQASLLLKTPGNKYDTFESLDDLRIKVRHAIEQTLVEGLQSLHEGGAQHSVLGQLRRLCEQLALITIRPTIPRKSEAEVFQLRSADHDLSVVAKPSTKQEIRIPTPRVAEILPASSPDSGGKAVLVLNGRLQWLSDRQRWDFLEEKPNPENSLGFSKPSHPNDPHVSELSKRLESKGYSVRWTSAIMLPLRLAEGAEPVYDDDGRYFECSGSILTCHRHRP